MATPATYQVTDAGNYLIFQDLDTGIKYSGTKAEIKVIPFETDQTQVYIYGTNLPGGSPAMLQLGDTGKNSQLFESDGTTEYTVETWETFYTANTGKSSAGDSALIYEGYLFQVDTEAPTVEWLSDDGGITMSYESVSNYAFNKVGLFDSSKTIFECPPFLTTDGDLGNAVALYENLAPDALQIRVTEIKDSGITNDDNLLSKTYFKITIKP